MPTFLQTLSENPKAASENIPIENQTIEYSRFSIPKKIAKLITYSLQLKLPGKI